MPIWHKMVEIVRKMVSVMILKDVSVLYEIGIFNGRYDKENANHHFILGIESVMDVINDLPTVDAVEVVRCKDCESYIPGKRICRSVYLNGYTIPNGYCFNGVRKKV